jgi:sugar phosphate isomerase/epimerase
MAMDRIDFGKAQMIARAKGLQPGRVKGTEGVQFTKGDNERLSIISWDEFEEALEERGLAIYESGGWMKIMKADQTCPM